MMADLGDLSVKISHQLNLNNFLTQKESRRSEILLLDNICERVQIAGSFSEGTELKESDMDRMMIHPYAIVVTSRKQEAYIPKQKVALLMCQNGFRPCYPILEVLTPDRQVQSAYSYFNVLNYVTTFEKYRNLCTKCVSSKAFLEDVQRIEMEKKHITKQWESELNGPAFTGIGTYINCDIVFAIPCCEWPPVASEWVKRVRKYQWPDKDLIERVVNTNCALVPFGDPFSEHKDIQWRISFTRGECHLIWSLNRQQFHCLHVLKGLIKRFFKEKPTISSFMLKTTLFWYIEDTDQTLWVDENFLVCVQQCIKKLIGFIKAEIMPHFFVRNNNIILNKFSSTQTEFKSIVLDFISINLHIFIFEAPGISHPDNLDFRLKEGYYSYFLHYEIESLGNYNGIEIFVDRLNEIDKVKARYIQKRHIDLAREIMFRILANECSALYMNHKRMLTSDSKRSILLIAEDCYERAAKVSPTSGHLILATFYLWQEKIDKLRTLLSTLDVAKISLYRGTCSSWNYVTLNPDIKNPDNVVKENDMFNFTSERDVTIHAWEKKFMPGIISCELEYNLRVCIYPPVYFRFIEFLLAKAEENKEHQLKSVCLLYSVIETMNDCDYIDVAYNILGYCHMTLGYNEAALSCFYKSFMYRSRSWPQYLNTSLYHSLVTIYIHNFQCDNMCWRTFQNEGLDKEDCLFETELNRLSRITKKLCLTTEGKK